MRLLVTGGRTGYLGRHVVAAAAGHDVVAVGSVDCDVRDRVAVDALLDAHRPDAVVHTAYVQSDREVTANGAAHVAQAAARVGARFVLVSSDVVFGGRPVPYDESVPPDPVSAYGAAKVAKAHADLERMLGDKDWLLGDRPTLADAYFAGIARWTKYHDVVDRRDYPGLQHLFEKLEADPAVRFAHAIERGDTAVSSGGFRGEVTLDVVLRQLALAA